jgi:hypothetical protein
MRMIAVGAGVVPTPAVAEDCSLPLYETYDDATTLTQAWRGQPSVLLTLNQRG